MMNKTELVLKHFEERVLSDFLFRLFNKEDDKFILLQKYLPYTLKELKNSKDAVNIRFLKLLEEYDFEINSTQEEEEWRVCGKTGKWIECFSCKGPELVISIGEVLNGADGDADYTIFVEFSEGTKGQYREVRHNYAIELFFHDDEDYDDEDYDDESYESEDLPAELLYEITGLGMCIYDMSYRSNEIVAYPFNTTCALNTDTWESRLVDKE